MAPDPFTWARTPTTADIEASHALKARLDPSFARQARDWWESRTASQLRVLRAGAWDACERETYATANYYLERTP